MPQAETKAARGGWDPPDVDGNASNDDGALQVHGVEHPLEGTPLADAAGRGEQQREEHNAAEDDDAEHVVQHDGDHRQPREPGGAGDQVALRRSSPHQQPLQALGHQRAKVDHQDQVQRNGDGGKN